MKLKQKYEKWMETGKLPTYGLCNSLMGTEYQNTLELFIPSSRDSAELYINSLDLTYWASGLAYNDNGNFYTFTPLRQTIVLLILAMHNEL